MYFMVSIKKEIPAKNKTKIDKRQMQIYLIGIVLLLVALGVGLFLNFNHPREEQINTTIYNCGGQSSFPFCPSMQEYNGSQADYILEGKITKVITGGVDIGDNHSVIQDSEILITKNLKGDIGTRVRVQTKIVLSECTCVNDSCECVNFNILEPIVVQEGKNVRLYIFKIKTGIDAGKLVLYHAEGVKESFFFRYDR